MIDRPPLPPGRLTAIFDFEVGGLYVKGHQLGARLSAVRDSRSVWVGIPDRDQTALGAERISGSYGKEDDPRALFAVQLVRVGVVLGEPEGPDVDHRNLVKAAEPTASQVVRDLMDWARTKDRQPWLAPPHIEPTPVGASWVENALGEKSPGVATEKSVIVMLSDEALPSGNVSKALDQDTFDEPASLLAEARWAVWPSRDADTKRAILLAAIALEVKASETLLDRADSTARPLVELLLARESSVNFMLTKVSKSVFGETLREFDGRLDKAMKELYRLRNDIAHRGETPAPYEARAAVRAAEDVFGWLGEVGRN